MASMPMNLGLPVLPAASLASVVVVRILTLTIVGIDHEAGAT